MQRRSTSSRQHKALGLRCSLRCAPRPALWVSACPSGPRAAPPPRGACPPRPLPPRRACPRPRARCARRGIVLGLPLKSARLWIPSPNPLPGIRGGGFFCGARAWGLPAASFRGKPPGPPGPACRASRYAVSPPGMPGISVPNAPVKKLGKKCTKYTPEFRETPAKKPGFLLILIIYVITRSKYLFGHTSKKVRVFLKKKGKALLFCRFCAILVVVATSQ